MGETVTVAAASNNNFLSTISIPSKLWGQNIEPQSFSILYNYNGGTQTYTVWDDGGGNLRYNWVNSLVPLSPITDEYCGNIIYEHGLAVLTPISESDSNPYGNTQGQLAALGNNTLRGQNGFGAGTNELQYLTVGWSSSVTLYEHQYKCTIRENEFGYSLNPSLLTGSISTDNNTTYKDFATGSYFSPYITTVGLYDNDQNLLAIGKLSVPTKVPMNADLEIQVAFDSL